MTMPNSTIVQARERDRGLRGFIRRHPIVSFFVLTDLLSWIAWIPYILSKNGVGIWDYSFPEILGTSQILGMLPGAYLGPITSALIVTSIDSGKEGLRDWGRRLVKWRVSWRWYALSLIGVPAALILVGFVSTGGEIQAPSLLVLAALIPGLIIQMLTTGAAEEPGWRDFAVPRLQSRYGSLAGAFILGPLWALWHLPLFLTEWGGFPDSSWTRPVYFTVFCIAFSIAMTWVFNRSKQSLPIAMLFHVSVNNFISIAWGSMFATLDGEDTQFVLMIGAIILAVALLATTKGRLGYLPEVRAHAAQLS